MPEEAITNEPIKPEEGPIKIVKRIPVVERRLIQFDNSFTNYLKVIYAVNLRGRQEGTEAYFPKRNSAIKPIFCEVDGVKGVALMMCEVQIVNGVTGDNFAITLNDVENGRVQDGKTPLTSLGAVVQYLLANTAL